MIIQLKKISLSSHTLKIIRDDKTSEESILDTKTYLLHDVCHFYVEKELNTTDGFWGMLSLGYRMDELFGKTNQLTEKLREIECIVGGTQSVYSNHMDETGFWDYLSVINHSMPDDNFLEKVLPKIDGFIKQWNYLPIGQAESLWF